MKVFYREQKALNYVLDNRERSAIVVYSDNTYSIIKDHGFFGVGHTGKIIIDEIAV